MLLCTTFSSLEWLLLPAVVQHAAVRSDPWELENASSSMQKYSGAWSARWQGSYTYKWLNKGYCYSVSVADNMFWAEIAFFKNYSCDLILVASLLNRVSIIFAKSSLRPNRFAFA